MTVSARTAAKIPIDTVGAQLFRTFEVVAFCANRLPANTSLGG